MRYEELFSTFPELLREILEEWKLNRELLQEIRIRAGRPVLAVCRNREYQSVKTINRTEMKEILACLSNYSLYACATRIFREETSVIVRIRPPSMTILPATPTRCPPGRDKNP